MRSRTRKRRVLASSVNNTNTIIYVVLNINIDVLSMHFYDFISICVNHKRKLDKNEYMHLCYFVAVYPRQRLTTYRVHIFVSPRIMISQCGQAITCTITTKVRGMPKCLYQN